MERHEQVAIPNTETRTTTVREEKQEVEQKVAVPHKSQIVTHKTVSHRPRNIRHLSFKRPVHKYMAAKAKATETKAVSQDTTIIKQETIVKPATIMERRDPALDAQ